MGNVILNLHTYICKGLDKIEGEVQREGEIGRGRRRYGIAFEEGERIEKKRSKLNTPCIPSHSTMLIC